MSIQTVLTGKFSRAFADIGMDPGYGEVGVSQRPDLSQFQCNGALPAAKQVHKNPREIASQVVASLEGDEIFASLNVDGPGFINIVLTDGFLVEQINSIIDDRRFGCDSVSAPRHVIIDFGGPNVAKSMHVGHLRSSIIGESLQRIFRFMGDRVTSDIHLGDWGTQMGMLIVELRRRQPDLPYFDPDCKGPWPKESPVSISDLEEMYPVASERCKSDPEEMKRAHEATVELQGGHRGYKVLWDHFIAVSLAGLREDFEELGVHFDLWLGESSVHHRIPALMKRLRDGGCLETSEGATVIRLNEIEGKEVPPLILEKTGGGYLYGTTDLATIEQRVDEYKADLVLYVVDQRQSFHFKQVFQVAYQTKISAVTELEHIGFGTVNGLDGKPFKTRTGGVMRLRDLIEMARESALRRLEEADLIGDYPEEERNRIAGKVGISAIKFADLSVQRTSDYVFDLEKFTRTEGRTGPYLLYAAVRIKSILRKAEERGFTPGDAILEPEDGERDLVLELLNFPEAVVTSYQTRKPHILAEYVYSLAQKFSVFYQETHILREDDRKRRASLLALVKLCHDEIEKALDLLGMETLERM